MGKFDFKIDPEFVRTLERMGDFDAIAPRLLDGAVPILERRVVAEANKYHKYSRDYELVKSIKKTKSFKSKKGWFVTVRPTGTDSGGVRNMEKMAHLEYGYDDRGGKHIAPKPILTKALNDSTAEVTAKMQEIFEEVVNER